MIKWKSTLLGIAMVTVGALLILPINPVDAGPRETGQMDRGDRGDQRGERRDRKEAGDRKDRRDRAEDPKERRDRKEAGDERDDNRKRVQERDRRDEWKAGDYRKKRRDWKRRQRSEVEFNIFRRENRRYRGPEWRRTRYWNRYRSTPFWFFANPFWYQYEDPEVCDWIFNVAKDTGSRKWQEMYWDCVDYYY